MLKYEETKIRKYENFIREILNSIVLKIDFDQLSLKGISFRYKIKERLRLDSEDGWSFLISSLDVIGDSQIAIIEFLNNRKINNDAVNSGDKYLRIYGVLSAIYIQQQAIMKLYEMFKVNSSKELRLRFNALEITFLRHCISAHPINYNTNGRVRSFRIARYSLWHDGNLVIHNQENEVGTYNIFHAIEEYIIEAENRMEEISRKVINTIYKSAKEKRKQLTNDLEMIQNNI